MTEGRLRPAENGPESKGQGGGGRQYNGGTTVPPVYCRACLMGGGGKGTQEALQGPRGIRARPSGGAVGIQGGGRIYCYTQVGSPSSPICLGFSQPIGMISGIQR